MRDLQPERNGPLDAFNLPAAVEEDALEPHHDLIVLLVHLRAEDEKPVCVTRSRISRAVSAANDNLCWGPLDDLEVVRQLRPRLVR